MKMDTTEKMAADMEGYLGSFQLWRGNAPDSPTVCAVRCSDGKVRYFNTTGDKVILRPTDRKSATAVMEDDTRQRQEALNIAMVADRWANVTVRG